MSEALQPAGSKPQGVLARTVREDVQATCAYSVASSEGMLKLDAMENPHQLPEPLRDALADLLKHAALNRYPPARLEALETALRRATPIPRAACVLFGNGSDELIDIVVRACCMPGDVVVSPVPTFVMYAVSCQWAHARFVGVDLKPDFTLDMPALLKAIVTHRPKVVFLAYPNNPTGVALKESEILQVLQSTDGLVVVDEAYEAFASATFMARVLEFPNLLVLRTLSKLGLAGIRLGYAVAGKAWIEQLDKVRPPYNVNILTRIAAEFALAHWDVLESQAQELKTNRENLILKLRALETQCKGLHVFDSQANFLLFRVPQAAQVFNGLKNQGILIKDVGRLHPLLTDCLRVTVSSVAENDMFLNAFSECVKKIP